MRREEEQRLQRTATSRWLGDGGGAGERALQQAQAKLIAEGVAGAAELSPQAVAMAAVAVKAKNKMATAAKPSEAGSAPAQEVVMTDSEGAVVTLQVLNPPSVPPPPLTAAGVQGLKRPSP